MTFALSRPLLRLLRALQPSRSLCVRLGLVIGAAVLGVALLVSWLIGDVVERVLRRHVGEELAVMAQQMAERLDRGMFERYREVQLFAPLLGGPGGLAGPEYTRPLLDKLEGTFEHYAWLGLVDLSGDVKVATDGLLEGEDVSNRPWFQGGLEGPYVGDVHESVLLAGILRPGPGGEPPRLVDIAAPVRGPDGEVLGVMAAHLSWEWADHVRRSVLQPVRHSRPVEMFVLASGIEHLARLTGRLFDLSQLEAGKLALDLHEADVSALVREAAEAAQARAPEREIACRVPAGERAEVDAGRVRQVLSNLLDNAVKFSPEGGRVDVELTRGEAALTITVRDRGLGIAPERRARLFEKHYQAHAADHRSGLKLGLYISREIVELHGGSLTAEFPEDGGTRMTVVLPTRRRVSPPEGGGS